MLIFLSKCCILSILCNKYLFKNFKFLPLWQKLAMTGSRRVCIGHGGTDCVRMGVGVCLLFLPGETGCGYNL